MIASTWITNPEIFAFLAFLIFKLLSRQECLQTNKQKKAIEIYDWNLLFVPTLISKFLTFIYKKKNFGSE